ncbi:hypothetical protein E2C01_068982 [Portunus trituberculatus]|uniref:Uncharacterized protein n=1 Tax=Portunus trituberculatus TaxID=210409 RepID=A0A5B7HXP7_PORTR|nr:hypothetical protein [Portunus trituberculatus]
MCPIIEGVKTLKMFYHNSLIPSVLRRIFTLRFVYNYTILLTLERVYGGQNINSHSLHYFIPQQKFMKLYKVIK